MAGEINESILGSIKKLIGIPETQTVFDADLIFHINTVLSILRDIGVGQDGFRISGATETWSDYLGYTTLDFEKVKDYIYIRTRILFDPPTNSFLLESLKSTANEFEWRLNVTYENSLPLKKEEEDTD